MRKKSGGDGGGSSSISCSSSHRRPFSGYITFSIHHLSCLHFWLMHNAALEEYRFLSM